LKEIPALVTFFTEVDKLPWLLSESYWLLFAPWAATSRRREA
jgi:hypothetical protein